MDKSFMHELDSLKSLDDLLDNPKHLKTMDFSQPHDDYSNWKDKLTKIRLMNVKWDPDKNVVNWQSVKERNAYFDRDDLPNTYDYTTQWNLLSLENFAPSLGVYKGNLIVDLPLEEALGYNYVAIDRYQQPVKDDPDSVVRSRFFFFITGVDSEPVAPNTTNLIIELDAWTEYSCEGFKTLAGDLERGHYAMDKLTTDEFFNDPLNTDVNIFAPEPQLPSVKRKVSYEKMVTAYGEPIIVICTVMNFKTQQPYLDNEAHEVKNNWWLDYKNYASRYSVSSKTSEKFARSIKSNLIDNEEPTWDVDGTSPYVPVGFEKNNGINQNITNIHYYGIELDEWENFLDYVSIKTPQVFDSLKAVFIIPREYTKIGKTFTSVFNIPMYELTQNNELVNKGEIKLTPDMFGYKETDYAKLYTGQFSDIEISDMNGNIANLSIEDTSASLSFMFRANTMFPFLKFEGFVLGIGGGLVNNYKLKPLNEFDYQGYLSKWETLHVTFDIPTYGIYQDAKSFSWRDGQALKRDSALARLNYEQEQNNINKFEANGLNDIDASFMTGTNTANQVNDNDNRSNQTTLDNGLNTAETNKDNANASNDTAFDNAKENAGTARDNGNRTNDTNLANALNSADNSKTNGDATNENGLNNAKETAGTQRDNGNRSNDTTLTNALKSADTNQENNNASNDASLKNALESAETTKTNGNASNDTALTNALASASNVKTTNTNSANLSKQTSDETAQLGKETSTNSANTIYKISERNTELQVKNSNANKDKVQGDFDTEQARLKANSDLALQISALGAVAGISVTIANGQLTNTPTGGAGDAISIASKAGVAALDAAETAGGTENQSNYEKGSKANTDKYIQTTTSNNETASHSNNSDNLENSTTNINTTYTTAKNINQQTLTTAMNNINLNYTLTVSNANRSHDTTAKNIALTYQTSVDIANNNHSVTKSNIAREYTTNTGNANRTHDTTATNIAQSYQTAIDVATNNYNTAKENIQRDYNTATKNVNRSHDTNAINIAQSYKTAIDVATKTYNTTADNIDRTYEMTVTNAKRTFNTNKANIAETFKTTNENLSINKTNSITNLYNDIDNRTTNNNIDYEKSQIEMNNKYTQMLNRPVYEVTENTGDGSLDAWGRRGFELKINRLNISDEETVTNEFSRYGYYMPCNTWVKAPTFEPIQSPNHKRHFSYWKFREIMSWSTEMSDTSKRVIMDILENGVTIYDTPEHVNNGEI